MKFDWIFVKVIHFDVNSDVNSQPFFMSFCRRHRLVLRQLPWKSGAVWLSTSKVINEISVKFDWIFLKVIHFDVSSDVNSQPFPMYICRHHRLVLRQLPCKFDEVWLSTSKVINEISVKFDWIFLKVIHFDVNSDVNSQPFFMSFCRRHRLVLRQLPWKSGAVWLSTSKVINEISVKFDWIFLKVIHFDVSSDVNSQPFPMYICRRHRLVLRLLPC